MAKKQVRRPAEVAAFRIINKKEKAYRTLRGFPIKYADGLRVRWGRGQRLTFHDRELLWKYLGLLSDLEIDYEGEFYSCQRGAGYNG